MLLTRIRCKRRESVVFPKLLGKKKHSKLGISMKTYFAVATSALKLLNGDNARNR